MGAELILIIQPIKVRWKCSLSFYINFLFSNIFILIRYMAHSLRFNTYVLGKQKAVSMWAHFALLTNHSIDWSLHQLGISLL